jgi:hypothetical protein
VHLPEDIYEKLKKAAGDRKASALVRDAITLIVDGGDQFSSGYNKGVRDCQNAVKTDKAASGIILNGSNVGAALENKMEKLIIKEKVNGKKKGTRGH